MRIRDGASRRSIIHIVEVIAGGTRPVNRDS
jgi:hypothetical protein